MSNRISIAVAVLSKSNYSETTPNQFKRVRKWISVAIAAGCDPEMVQQPLHSLEDAGEWKLVLRRCKDGPGELPENLWDAAFVTLASMGRIQSASGAKPWDGQVLLDDSTTRATAFRLKLARKSLKLPFEAFYKPCEISPKIAKDMEACRRDLNWFDAHELARLCNGHDIPEVWLLFGEASPLERHPRFV